MKFMGGIIYNKMKSFDNKVSIKSENIATRKIYKVRDIDSFEMFPSDPFGSLDVFFLRLYFYSGGSSNG